MDQSSASPHAPERSSADASALERLLADLQAHRAVLVRAPLLVAVGALAVSAMLPTSFSTSTALVPQVDLTQMRGAGLAAQLGINLPGSDLTQSPDFYVSFVRSNTFLGELVDRPYPFVTSAGDTVQRNLVTELEIEAKTHAVARLKAIIRLGELVRASSELKTGVVRLSVTMPERSLALQVTQQALAQIDDFNNQKRRTRGAQEVRFLEARIADARQDLSGLERQMQQFLERNRAYESSAPLTFEHDRIERELTLARQLHSSLSQQLDQARIERVRDTPLVTVVESPRLAARPNRRYLAFKGLIGSAAAFGALVLLLLTTDQLRALDPGDAVFGQTADRVVRRLLRR